jgi:hypothetical protein
MKRKDEPPTDRSLQLLATALFAFLLLLAIVLLSSCADRKPETRTFSRPKYEVTTHGTPARGKSNVSQKWYKRWWFWQRARQKNDDNP